MSIETVTTISRECAVLNQHQIEVQATAAGMVRAAIMRVDGVSDAVRRALHGQSTYADTFIKAENLDAVGSSVDVLLAGNGRAAGVLREAEEDFTCTLTGGRSMEDIYDADPRAAALIVDVRAAAQKFFEDRLKPIGISAS